MALRISAGRSNKDIGFVDLEDIVDMTQQGTMITVVVRKSFNGKMSAWAIANKISSPRREVTM